MSAPPDDVPGTTTHRPRAFAVSDFGQHDWLSPQQWRRRILFWSGAIVVGLAAVFFAKAADYAFEMFHGVASHGWWVPLLITPAMFALLCWLTQGALKATRGSGIPQAIAALKVEDEDFRGRLLSLKVALGKMALTLAALLGGASVGREGPPSTSARACSTRWAAASVSTIRPRRDVSSSPVRRWPRRGVQHAARRRRLRHRGNVRHVRASHERHAADRRDRRRRRVAGHRGQLRLLR